MHPLWERKRCHRINAVNARTLGAHRAKSISPFPGQTSLALKALKARGSTGYQKRRKWSISQKTQPLQRVDVE
jgi:hypothetical protein